MESAYRVGGRGLLEAQILFWHLQRTAVGNLKGVFETFSTNDSPLTSLKVRT